MLLWYYTTTVFTVACFPLHFPFSCTFPIFPYVPPWPGASEAWTPPPPLRQLGSPDRLWGMNDTPYETYICLLAAFVS